MITASSWLDGPGFLGLRRLAREVADEIIVVDLHGDNKGTRKDENVFDIESPVAIVTLVRRGRGNRSSAAPVRYASYRGTRAKKLATLSRLAADNAVLLTDNADADWYAPFIPVSGGIDWAASPALTELFPLQQPGMMINRTWPVAPDRDTLERRWQAFTNSKLPDERARFFVTPPSGRRITTKVPGTQTLADLGRGAPHQPIVRLGMRSFDRQWIFEDPRVIALERPALWASLSERQIFLTTMTTTSLGAGPATTLATSVPDKHHFRGSYGGKDVIPLYRDARGTPNVDPNLLNFVTRRRRETDPGASDVTPERLFAYVFAVLAGADYTERFHEALETPGPRVPLTADPKLFDETVQHGEQLLWLQTFGERFAAGRGPLPLDDVKWKFEPTRLPTDKSDIAYAHTTSELSVADGVLTGVTPDVYAFEVSGMDVIPKWLGYRMVKPAGRAASSDSPLDKIRPETWSPAWSKELVEVVAVLKASLALLPVGVALLDQILDGPLIAASDLPAPPAWMRLPPKTKADNDSTLFSDEKLD